jgi:two-component system sensor histidine kinase BaeS
LRLSLIWKFLIAFAAVAVMSMIAVSIIATQVAAREVRAFDIGGGAHDVGLVLQQFEAYYEAHGNWEGVQLLMRMPGWLVLGRQGAMGGMPAPRLTLTDPTGVVIASVQRPVGEQVAQEDLAKAEPVKVQGQTVALLLAEGAGFATPREDLISRLNRAMWYAALVAGSAAILIGAVLVLGMLRPIRELTAAVRTLAQGNLSGRVKVHSSDELGELSRSFNQMAQSLEDAEKSRREMTADIAHELRTPLSVMQARLEALIDGVYAIDAENLKSVLTQTKVLNRLVEDLRTLSLAEAGRLELESTEVNLGALAKRAVEGYRATAEAGGVRLGAAIPDEQLVVQGDPLRLDQVLGNLLSNALRYTPSGGEVLISVRSAGPEKAVIEVADTGRGIPEEILPHLWDRFRRLGWNDTRAEGGSGLGLSIARKIVEAQGGRIEAANRPEGGAIFTITLPLAGTQTSA